LCSCSAWGRWLRVNRRLCDMLGYSEQELLGLGYEALIYPDDRAANAEGVGKVLRREESILRMDMRYIRKDGTPLWVNLTAALARDAAGASEAVRFTHSGVPSLRIYRMSIRRMDSSRRNTFPTPSALAARSSG